jgi:hypothetical protein
MAEMRRMPEEVTSEAANIIESAANGAGATIKGGYPSRTGNLRNKLTVEHRRSRFGARSVVVNTSKHADEFEHGTQGRHTAIGANRGAMPANHLFTRTVIQKRRQMYEQLQELLERKGLTVTNDA